MSEQKTSGLAGASGLIPASLAGEAGWIDKGTVPPHPDREPVSLFTPSKHFIGKVYELTQENFNGVVAAWEDAERKVVALRHQLEEREKLVSQYIAHEGKRIEVSCNGLIHDDTCECTREAALRKLRAAEAVVKDLANLVESKDRTISALEQKLTTERAANQTLLAGPTVTELTDRVNSMAEELHRVKGLCIEKGHENARMREVLELISRTDPDGSPALAISRAVAALVPRQIEQKPECCCWGFDHPPCPVHPGAIEAFKAQFAGKYTIQETKDPQSTHAAAGSGSEVRGAAGESGGGTLSARTDPSSSASLTQTECKKLLCICTCHEQQARPDKKEFRCSHGPYKIQGTTGCQNCEDGRVTLYYLKDLCIRCELAEQASHKEHKDEI